MFSRFFIDRPVFSWVIAIIIMLAGILSFECILTRYPVDFDAAGESVSSDRSSSSEHHCDLSWCICEHD